MTDMKQTQIEGEGKPPFFRRFLDVLNELAQKLNLKMAIKITLTALLSLFACLQLDYYLKHPQDLLAGLWCVVSSIIVLQTNIGGTYKAIWNRFLGVLIGSAMGAFFALAFGAETLMMGLAIFVTIILCSLIGIQESFRMAALSVVIIMLPWKVHHATHPVIFAFFRFFDTCVGFFVAVLVSHLLWPAKALTKMRSNMAETFNLFRQYFEQILIPEDSLNKSERISDSLSDEIDLGFAQSRMVLEESKIELLVRFAPGGTWINLLNCQENIWECLRSLKSVYNATVQGFLDEEFKEQVRLTVEGIDFAFKELASKLKEGWSDFNFLLLGELQEILNRELVRFRTTKVTRKQSIELVEDYFVFFYQLKQILQLLSQFNQQLNSMHLGEKAQEIED